MKVFFAGFLTYLMIAFLVDLMASLMAAFSSNFVASSVKTFLVGFIFFYPTKFSDAFRNFVAKSIHLTVEDYFDIQIP